MMKEVILLLTVLVMLLFVFLLWERLDISSMKIQSIYYRGEGKYAIL